MSKHDVTLVVMSDTNIFTSGNEYNLCETKGSDKEFLKECAKSMIKQYYSEEYYNDKTIQHSLIDYVSEKLNSFGDIRCIKFMHKNDILCIHRFE